MADYKTLIDFLTERMQSQDLIEIYDSGDSATKYSVGIPVLIGSTSAVFSLLRHDGHVDGFMWLDYSNLRKLGFGTKYLRQFEAHSLEPKPGDLEDADLENVLRYLLDKHLVCAIDDLEGNETLGFIRHLDGGFIQLWEIQEGAPDGEALLPLNQVGEVRFGGPVHKHLAEVRI